MITAEQLKELGRKYTSRLVDYDVLVDIGQLLSEIERLRGLLHDKATEIRADVQRCGTEYPYTATDLLTIADDLEAK